jgi:hypothetical protein
VKVYFRGILREFSQHTVFFNGRRLVDILKCEKTVIGIPKMDQSFLWLMVALTLSKDAKSFHISWQIPPRLFDTW